MTRISWEAVDGGKFYLPLNGVVELGIEPHEKGNLIRADHLLRVLNEIESDEANVLENVIRLKKYLAKDNKDTCCNCDNKDVYVNHQGLCYGCCHD